MTGKKDGRRLHKTGRKECFGNPKMPEWLINSLRKVLRKVEKLWIRREKFPTRHGKKLENDSKGKGKMPGNGKRKPKKTGFSFEKNSGKALKKREWDEKISQHWTKNIPMKRKNLENG